MSFFDPQNPGISGLSDFTIAELAFIHNLITLPYVTGDILYYNGTQLTRLGIGTAGQALVVTAGLPAWGAAGSGSGTVNSGTQYQMTFYAANGTAVSGNNGITTDSHNNFALAPTATTGAPNSGFNYTSPAHTALTA